MQEVARITYTAPELAKALGVSRAGAYNLMNCESFPSFRIGRKPVVRKEALEEWIKEQEGLKKEWR